MSSVKIRLFVFGLATFVGLNLLSNQLGAQTQAVTQAPVTTGAAVAAPQQGGELERITVTGYLIPRIGEGPQPVLTLDRDFMQKQGTQAVADVIQRLPGTPLTFNQGFATGNNGTPGVNAPRLRGLGPEATLVLVDGSGSRRIRFRLTRPMRQSISMRSHSRRSIQLKYSKTADPPPMDPMRWPALSICG